MAMTSCGECNAEISTTAKACPKCGAVKPRRKVWPWLVGTPVALFAALMLWGASIPEYERRALQVRDVCLEIAAPHQRHVCENQYEEALAEGRASAQP